MALDLKAIESDVREFWDEHSIVEEVRASTRDGEPFFMIDGPPYLTGPPHMGQMQNKTTKDVMMRFKQMQGFRVHDQAGFDTHGLPNEVKTEEELGIENKNEIGDSISVEEFIEKCRERAVSAQDVWKDVMWRLAVWQDFENPYLTYENDYIESVWWFIASAAEREMLYDARKPIYWCGRCQTSLSGYEVTDEYREVSDPAIYVKFPLSDRDDEYLLIWTTTPWTIPGNMAIVVHPDFRYARVRVDEEVLIMAEALVEDVMETAGYDDEEYEVLNTFTGAELQGKGYDHPLTGLVPEQGEMDEAYRNVHTVIADDELVTLEEGTGVVHAASGHGPEDYEVVTQYDIPVFSPVDKEGVYTHMAGEYAGLDVYVANHDIVEDLDDVGVLFFKQEVDHEFPHCWRCKSRIIYRATRQWFLDIDPIKERMLEENEDVDWYPEHAGSKRFRNWLGDAHDWCISRQNYWGIPLPVWECGECGDLTVVGSFMELEELNGSLPEEFDPHKHVVDDLAWECGACGEGVKERVPDNIDVWCDSGCAPFASLHYPFDEQPFDEMHPMDFIVEGSDQIRGWFYSLMFCGVTLFDEAPYDKVCLQAFVLDERGQKMSKSIGNVVDPVEVMDEFGTDVPRFWIMENSKQWDNAKVDLDEMRDETRRLLNVYWNTAQFLQSYRDGPVAEPDALEAEDRWVLSRLHNFLEEADVLYDTCHFHQFCRDFESFVLDDVSRWYVKLIRDRAKSGDEAALWTLQEVVRLATLAVAPIVPHITEKIYRDLYGEEKSVHMETFPEADEAWIDDDLERDMAVVRELIDTVNALRQEEDMNLRWPAKKIVCSVTAEDKEAIERLEGLVRDRANVKTVEFGDVATKLVAKPNYASIGPRFEEDADSVARHIEEMDHDQIEQLEDVGEIWLDDHQVREEDVHLARKAAGHVAGKDFRGGEVYLDTKLTADLEKEALVRELVRNVQEARKEAGLDVQDDVDLWVWGNSSIVADWADTVQSDVNIRELHVGEEGGEHTGSAEFREYSVRFGFERV